MELYFKREECCGCGACVDVCRVQAVRMTQDGEGFLYPEIDRSICVHCGRCEEVCPVKKHTLPDEVRRPAGYVFRCDLGYTLTDKARTLHRGMDYGRPSENPSAECCNQYIGARAKSAAVRNSSSSGGMFSILAQYVLERKGVVFGAGYNSRMEVVHRGAENLEQLEKIKRTKYVQSNMQGIFLKAEQCLKERRWVLFCGTPCQAQALRLFLGQEHDTLIVVDLVCYGVPSPGIWEDYVKYLEHRHQGKMTEFSFRDKRAQDHGHTCAYVINGEEYAGSLFQDRFCRMYFKNYILRPSCHSCKFCTVDRSSDFTIGDFWGIEKVRQDLNDGMGNSMMILHTEKAKRIWEEVREDADWFECTKEDLLQPRLTEPTVRAKGRRMFMLLYKLLPFFLFIRAVDDRTWIWKLFRKK